MFDDSKANNYDYEDQSPETDDVHKRADEVDQYKGDSTSDGEIEEDDSPHESRKKLALMKNLARSIFPPQLKRTMTFPLTLRIMKNMTAIMKISPLRPTTYTSALMKQLSTKTFVRLTTRSERMMHQMKLRKKLTRSMKLVVPKAMAMRIITTTTITLFATTTITTAMTIRLADIAIESSLSTVMSRDIV